jgi:hypothetical protein
LPSGIHPSGSNENLKWPQADAVSTPVVLSCGTDNQIMSQCIGQRRKMNRRKKVGFGVLTAVSTKMAETQIMKEPRK